MSEHICIRDWVEQFNQGKFNSPDLDTQIDAGWFDWFCRDSSLGKKTQKLGKCVKVLMHSPKVSADTQYVFFKNNCPVNGKLYDSFSICEMDSRNVIYWVTPSSGFDHIKGKAEVYGRENDFKEPLVSGDWNDVIEFFFAGAR